MPDSDKKRTYFIYGFLIVCIWTFVAIIFTVKTSMNASMFGRPFSFSNTFWMQLVSCMGWMILTPLIIWGAKKYLPIGQNLHKNITYLILLGIFVVFFQTTFQSIVLPILDYEKVRGLESFLMVYKGIFTANWLLSASLYLLSLGVILTLTFYKKYQERELQSSKLEANLSRARLQVLQMQLHPHFLFNTHNAITELIHKDPDTAEKMLTNLSDLLRISLDKIDMEKVLFHQELEFVEKYIEIEQMRFQERLKFSLNIAPETLDAIVPNMILQPLIENAVKHGITPLREGGTIKIKSHKKANDLIIEVSDDGVGLSKDEKDFVVKGIGLANTQARLLHLYKDKQSFEIDFGKEKGFTVKLKIPFTKETAKNEEGIELINPKLVENN